jgi:hypothetical protein
MFVFLFLATVSVYAALPPLAMPVLYQVAMNTTRRMALETLGRGLVIDMIPETSWVSTFQRLMDQDVGIFRMANGGEAALQYEVPVDLENPVLDPAVEGVTCGQTASSPCPFSADRFSLGNWVEAWEVCSVPMGNVSTDGQPHVIDMEKVYTSFEQLGEDCIANTSFRKPNEFGYTGAISYYTIGETGDVIRVDDVLVEEKMMALYDSENRIKAIVWMEYDVWGSVGGEAKDDIKRFKQSGDGFLPDETDPDWEKEELENFGEPKNIRFRNANEMMTIVKAGDGGMSYIEYVKEYIDGEIIRRKAYFDSRFVPQEVVEELIKDDSFDSLGDHYYLNVDPKVYPSANTQPGTNPGSGTDTGTDTDTDTRVIVNVDTSDLAKAGEAESAAEQIVKELQAEEIETIDQPWKSEALPDFGERNNDIENLVNDTGPEINWDDFIPNVFPGNVVACHPIEYEATISTGPAGGLSSKTNLDVCWVFGLIRSILAWFFGAITFVYLYRTFTRSSVEGA